MSKKITLRELKQHLKQKTQADLVVDIADLFNKIEAVKDYYQARLSDAGDLDDNLIAKYKTIIEKVFFPTRGISANLPRLSVARKAISDYKKISNSPQGLADLMLFYVEVGVRYTNTYGDIDEPFYSSLEGMYERGVKIIVKHALQAEFEERCHQVVYDTNGMGWGFHDTLYEIYHEHFGS